MAVLLQHRLRSGRSRVAYLAATLHQRPLVHRLRRVVYSAPIQHLPRLEPPLLPGVSSGLPPHRHLLVLQPAAGSLVAIQRPRPLELRHPVAVCLVPPRRPSELRLAVVCLDPIQLRHREALALDHQPQRPVVVSLEHQLPHREASGMERRLRLVLPHRVCLEPPRKLRRLPLCRKTLLLYHLLSMKSWNSNCGQLKISRPNFRRVKPGRVAQRKIQSRHLRVCLKRTDSLRRATRLRLMLRRPLDQPSRFDPVDFQEVNRASRQPFRSALLGATIAVSCHPSLTCVHPL